jgi:dienelactone hydrolase
VLDTAALLAGLALAVLVGCDGSPGWAVVRVIAVALVTAAIVGLMFRTSDRRRGLVAALAGMPVLAIAAGFTPHLFDGRLIVQGATFLLAVASVALIVAGVIAAVRGSGVGRVLATSLAVLVMTAVTALVVGPAVAVTNTPHRPIGATPAVVGLTFEEVVLPASDGVSLAGWYVPGSNGAAVVLLHGAGSTRSDVLDQAAVLADAGFAVLMIDARGHGESTGRAMDFGWYGDADVAAATSYLETRRDVDPDRIGVVGMSMGGEEAVGATGSNPSIKAVVAEGATARAAADEAWLSDVYGVRGFVQEQLERVQDWVTAPLTDAPVPAAMRDSVAASGRTRFLFITGGDVPDERHAALFMADAAPDRVEVWTIDDAGHTDGLRVAREEWILRVTGFLDDVLLAG